MNSSPTDIEVGSDCGSVGGGVSAGEAGFSSVTTSSVPDEPPTGAPSRQD
jgi:hypothetical protein